MNDSRSNMATCGYALTLAAGENLHLFCCRGNPTGSGIHNKMVLVKAGGQGWVHVGSINGSENSSKANRELAVQVKSTGGYDYLAGVFWHDWVLTGGTLPVTERKVFLPIIVKGE